VSRGAGQGDRSGASRWEKTGTVLLGSESNQLAFCAAVMAQVRDLCYLLSGTQVPNYSKRYWADRSPGRCGISCFNSIGVT